MYAYSHYIERVEMLDDITGSMDMSLSKLQEVVKDREAWRWHAALHGIAELNTTKWLNNNKSGFIC